MPAAAAGSLRLRLLARAALALALLFTIAAAAIYLLLRASLLTSFDASLATEASALASLAEQDSSAHIKIELEPGELPEFHRAKLPHYFQLWNQDGSVLSRSPSLAAANLDRPPDITEKPLYRAIGLPSGKRGRMIAYTFAPRLEDEPARAAAAAAGAAAAGAAAAPQPTTRPLRTVTLAVAQPTHDLDETLDQVALVLAVVSGAAILASIVLLALVIRRGLRPLDALATSIERVGVHDLADRIRLDSAPRELTAVVQRLNELLARLEAAMTREKSFTADVAHELRTPLAGLATALEVCASRRREPEAYEQAIAKCLPIARGMEAMVNNLLLLARADARQLIIEAAPLHLATFLRECWAPFEPRAAQRGLRVEWQTAEAANDTGGGTITVDRDKLRIVLNNLFDNAVTYADDAGRIRIESSPAEMRISNTGNRLTPEDLTKIFDRFWRADPSRSAPATHCGLGLTLCRKVMDVLGGSIAVRADDGTFTAILHLRSDVA